MIQLRNLITEETFTAINKKSGKTSVFKSKDSRNSAIKAGTHDATKDSSSDKEKTSKGSETPKVNIFDKPSKDSSTNSKDTKSDTPKVSPTKLTKLMPKANKDTFSGKSDINKIPDAQKKEISMRIDKLAELTKQAKEKGEAAPNFNLCKVTVPGTNLYCSGNAGIPREEMPQFKGKPTPGSPASKMALDASGEVDTEPMFKKMLKEKGIKTAETESPSDALKATQSELVGSKVAGMAKALEKDPNNSGITAPIYVSRDGFVIDGHHRWAAVTSAAIAAGKPANMKVIVIDMDIKDAIPMANSFAEEIGVAAKKADANKETPSQSDPKQSSKPDTQGDKFELGTPAVYTDNGQEYRGEVVMNPSNQRVQIGGKWTTIGKGTTKGIQVYGSDTFIVPDNWNDAKSFDDAMEKPAAPAQPKQQRKGNPQVNKAAKSAAEEAGITPQKLGGEYKDTMYKAAIEALTDSNYHDEARELIAKLEGKPEWAKKPEYPSMDDPQYDEKMKALRTTGVDSSEYWDYDDNTGRFARKVSNEASWDGAAAVDGIAFTLRMNGFHKEADMIQSVIKESVTRLTTILKETTYSKKKVNLKH